LITKKKKKDDASIKGVKEEKKENVLDVPN
jgi:hypothetical protein